MDYGNAQSLHASSILFRCLGPNAMHIVSLLSFTWTISHDLDGRSSYCNWEYWLITTRRSHSRGLGGRRIRRTLVLYKFEFWWKFNPIFSKKRSILSSEMKMECSIDPNLPYLYLIRHIEVYNEFEVAGRSIVDRLWIIIDLIAYRIILSFELICFTCSH